MGRGGGVFRIMKKKSYAYIVLFIAIFWLTLWFFYWLVRSPYFVSIDSWIKTNKVIFVVSLYLYKTLGVLWPPIPAGLFTLMSIPFLGWSNAYLIDLLGSISGGTIAYHLGKKYGLPLLKKIFSDDIVEKIQKAKIKKGREIEAVFFYKILLGSTILEAVYYGAGFLRIGFNNFLIGSVLSHMLVGIPSFFLIGNIFSGRNFAISVVLSILALLLIFKTKGRYFE